MRKMHRSKKSRSKRNDKMILKLLRDTQNCYLRLKRSDNKKLKRDTKEFRHEWKKWKTLLKSKTRKRWLKKNEWIKMLSNSSRNKHSLSSNKWWEKLKRLSNLGSTWSLRFSRRDRIKFLKHRQTDFTLMKFLKVTSKLEERNQRREKNSDLKKLRIKSLSSSKLKRRNPRRVKGIWILWAQTRRKWISS